MFCRPIPISNIMQNFTPIGGTVAEICGAVQKDMHKAYDYTTKRILAFSFVM